MNPALQDHAVKAEILDLLHLRARGADRFDVPLMRDCHPAAATDNHGTYQGPMHGFLDNLETAMQSGPPCLSKLHIVANALFDRLGDDIFVESYHVAHEIFELPEGVTDYRIGGRYLDTFRRVDGRWMIQHRDIVYDWSRVLTATAAFWGEEQPATLTGSRTGADPLYLAHPTARGRLPAVPAFLSGDYPMDAIQRLLDKQAIAEVLYRRARASDRSDPELAHACYHPGATERHGAFDGEAAEFIDIVSWTRTRPGSPVVGMQHLITNILADFANPDAAFVESYHVAYCQMTSGLDAAIGGRYLDRFERRDGRWAIAHRDVIFDWSRVEPETEKFWAKYPAADFLHGKRGDTDPLYAYVGRGK
jgi:SnoaL-like domain